MLGQSKQRTVFIRADVVGCGIVEIQNCDLQMKGQSFFSCSPWEPFIKVAVMKNLSCYRANYSSMGLKIMTGLKGHCDTLK